MLLYSWQRQLATGLPFRPEKSFASAANPYGSKERFFACGGKGSRETAESAMIPAVFFDRSVHRNFLPPGIPGERLAIRPTGEKRKRRANAIRLRLCGRNDLPPGCIHGACFGAIRRAYPRGGNEREMPAVPGPLALSRGFHAAFPRYARTVGKCNRIAFAKRLHDEDTALATFDSPKNTKGAGK